MDLNEIVFYLVKFRSFGNKTIIAVFVEKVIYMPSFSIRHAEFRCSVIIGYFSSFFFQTFEFNMCMLLIEPCCWNESHYVQLTLSLPMTNYTYVMRIRLLIVLYPVQRRARDPCSPLCKTLPSKNTRKSRHLTLRLRITPFGVLKRYKQQEVFL